jgi:hypothetical protein
MTNPRVQQLHQSGAALGHTVVWDGTTWVAATAATGMDVLANFDDRWGSALGSYDYEFGAADTTSLPAGWSWVNQGSSAYREVGGLATITASYTGGSTSATETHRMITRARPSESAWDLLVKIPSLNCEQVANVRAGIVARNSGSGNYLLHGRAITDANISRVKVDTWSALNTISTTEANSVMVSVPTHFRLTQIDASTWVFGVSNDGSIFVTLGFYDPSGDGYDEVGICVGLPDTGTFDVASAAIDWFRIR